VLFVQYWLYILIYLAAINIVTFFLFGIDKWKAKRSKWRIEEATLLWWAAFGGSIGALFGMRVWHHKTLHRKFTWGVPAILIAQIAIVGVIVYYMVIATSGSSGIEEAEAYLKKTYPKGLFFVAQDLWL